MPPNTTQHINFDISFAGTALSALIKNTSADEPAFFQTPTKYDIKVYIPPASSETITDSRIKTLIITSGNAAVYVQAQVLPREA